MSRFSKRKCAILKKNVHTVITWIELFNYAFIQAGIHLTINVTWFTSKNKKTIFWHWRCFIRIQPVCSNTLNFLCQSCSFWLTNSKVENTIDRFLKTRSNWKFVPLLNMNKLDRKPCHFKTDFDLFCLKSLSLLFLNFGWLVRDLCRPNPF